MDTHAQMQAIVDRLAGSGLAHPLSAFDEPWRTIYSRVARAGDEATARQMLRRAVGDLPAPASLYRRLHDLFPPAGSFSSFPSVLELAPRLGLHDWLWPSWIPVGMLTILAASPGAGKSLVALDLARRIIAGEPFPDGAPVPGPGRNILVVDSEGTSDLLHQRAQAWRMDLSRLYLMLTPQGQTDVDLSDRGQRVLLWSMICQLEPALVVVDSLGAVAAREVTGSRAVRDLLLFLEAVARKAHLSMLIVHHLRKRTRPGQSASRLPVAADDLRGSSVLSAAARSILALGPAGPQPGRDPVPGSGSLVRLEVVKTNLCRRPPALGLVFEGGEQGAPTLRYTGPLES
jgi:hypothetical protein